MRSIRNLAVVSVVMSLLATLLVYRYVANTENRVVSQLQPTKVLVATEDISAGTKSTDLEDLTKEVVVPFRSFPSGALQSVSDVRAEYVTLSRILAGSYIFIDQLGDASRLVGGLVVPVGKVVLTVEMSGPEHLGRFVQPGVTVAIYKSANGTTSLIIPKTEVLAIADQLGTGVSTSDKASVTFALLPDDATKLLIARQTGAIQLALLGEGADGTSTGAVR